MDNTKNNHLNKVSFTGKEYFASDYKNDWPKEWVDIYYKEYPRFERVKLNINEDGKLLDLKEALRKRESHIKIGVGEMNFEILSKILFYSLGMKKYLSDGNLNKDNRFYASGGKRYSIEAYFFVKDDSVGLKKGIYHYNVHENSFEYMWEIEGNPKFTLYKNKDKAKVIVVLTSVIGRNYVKYGELSYKFSYIETGLILQNISLLSTSYGISNSLINHDDYMLESQLDIDGEGEFVTGQIALDFLT